MITLIVKKTAWKFQVTTIRLNDGHFDFCTSKTYNSSNQIMPVPSGSLYGGQGKPSCYDRVSTSFMMGATIGITIGILFGGLGGLRSGYRGRELVGSMGKTMLQSGGTFGTFMGVGAALRC